MKDLTALSPNIVITISLLFILSGISYGQINPYNFTRVKQNDGLVMQRIDHDGGQTSGKCIMNFHSDADEDHPDFIYMRATATDNNNNLILTDAGLLMVGATDDCFNMRVPNFDGATTNAGHSLSDVRLYVDGQIAVKSGNATSTIVSDQRLKKDIAPLKNSLDIIRQTNFVEYHYNDLSDIKSGKKYYGVLAQEMQDVLPTTVGKAKKRLRPNDQHETEILMFNPNDLIYSGLNAIKELDEENQALKDRVAELEEEVEANKALEQRVTELENLLTQLVGKEADSLNDMPQNTLQGTSYLSQNQPNPLNKSTVIEYQLPNNTSDAYILIQDLTGSIIVRYDLQKSNRGSVTFDAERYGINSGTYVYSLIVDGVITASKKMIFIN